MEFMDLWLWLILMVVGLVFVITELLVGVDTGLDLVFIGSCFIIGGLVTWPFHSWPVTVIVIGVISTTYIFLGRRYVHRWTLVRKEKTNVDAIIGKHGIVVRDISNNSAGMVRVGSELWRAVAGTEITEGVEVEVIEINGVTLTVQKPEGGN